jgi:hypothetical protein
MDALAQSLKASAELYPHTLDVTADAVGLARLSQEALKAASFLDARALAPGAQLQWVAWPQIEAAVQAAGLEERCGFIFHLGHTGSTLLSRLIGAHPSVLSLREPLPLRALAQQALDVEAPESAWGPAGLESRTAAFVRLWSRTFSDEQLAVVKATSFASALAERLLTRPGRPRAVVIYSRPEPYLATVLAGANTHLDIRASAGDRLKRLHRAIGGPRWRLAELAYPEVVAMSWAAEMTALDAAARAAPGQVLWLEFDRLLLRPQAGLAAAFAHFERPASAQEIAAIVSGPEMGRYSKAPDHAYDAGLRGLVLEEARRLQAPAMARGLAWLGAAAKACPPIGSALARAGGS